MRWFRSNKDARKILRIFLTLFFLLIGVGIFSISGVKQISIQFRKLFQQRLIPALDMARLVELQYQNRFHLEEHITGVSNENYLELERDMAINNHKMDSILKRYTTSSYIMDPREAKDLKSFVKAHKRYLSLEDSILILSKRGEKQKARELFTQRSYSLFQNNIRPLIMLEDDQADLGRNLYYEAQKQVDRIYVWLYVVMGVAVGWAVVMGIVVGKAAMDP
jgi:hypothetical protein